MIFEALHFRNFPLLRNSAFFTVGRTVFGLIRLHRPQVYTVFIFTQRGFDHVSILPTHERLQSGRTERQDGWPGLWRPCCNIYPRKGPLLRGSEARRVLFYSKNKLLSAGERMAGRERFCSWTFKTSERSRCSTSSHSCTYADERNGEHIAIGLGRHISRQELA